MLWKTIVIINTSSTLIRITALLLIFSLGACRKIDHGGSPGKKPNIVIVVMDTVRRDHLSCYDYKRATTPNLESLSRQARTYLNAYSTSGWTNPAHASLFTGLYPVVHQTTQENEAMGPDLFTLAEVLKVNGYSTVGIVENPQLSQERNFNQGFDEYIETWKLPDAEKWGEEHFLNILRNSLEGSEGEKPFFLFVNFISPHSPYYDQHQFSKKFVSDTSIPINSNMWRSFFLGEKTFTPEEINHIVELYDSQIYYVDYLIGRMMDLLKSRNVWDNTIFIVASDHGEHFLEHGLMDHVFSLYEPLTKIPLIIYYPTLFNPGSIEMQPVQLVDIFPTILNILEIDPESYFTQGENLLALSTEKERDIFGEYYFPRQVFRCFQDNHKLEIFDRYRRRLKFVISGDYKLIWSSQGDHELYNLKLDPDEKRNLAEAMDYQEVRESLLVKISQFNDGYDMSSFSENSTFSSPLEESTRNKLRTLGYLP